MDKQIDKNQNSITKNFIFNLLYQVLLYSVPLITTPYLSRILGAEQIGKYSFAQSIVSYFVLAATLGTTLYGQRKIASLHSEPQKQTIAFWQIVLLRLFTTILALIVYGLVILPICVDMELYIIASIELLAVCMDITWFYQGQENFGIITKCNGACKILSILFIFIFVRTQSDLDKYVFIYCGLIVLGNLIQWFYLKEYLIRIRFEPDFFKDILAHLKSALSLFIAQIAMQVYTVLDKTMIGLITKSDAQNGYYEQAQKVIRVLTALTTSISTVMASRIAMLWKDNKQEEIKWMIEMSFRITFCIACPIVCGVFLIAKRFVPIFYGSGYDEVIPLLCVLSILVLVVGCSNIIGIQYLVPTNREKLLTDSVMVGAVVNLILNSIFIPRYQALGAAIASVIAEICVTLTQMWLVRRELDCRRFFVLAIRYIGYCVPFLGVGYLLNTILPNNLIGLAVLIIISVIIYASELLLSKDKTISILIEMRKPELNSKEGNSNV